MSDNFSAKVWETLSTIDVTPYVEYMPKTGNRPAMRYVPWHRAWTLLKSAFPGSTYEHQQDTHHPDGTVEVEVVVNIREAAPPNQCVWTRARLAVMDNMFRAIPNPNARDINDNRQRALVKALAFAGLGLNLWDGTDIPVGYANVNPITADQLNELQTKLDKTKADVPRFLEWAGVSELEELPQNKLASALKLLDAKAKK